MKLLMDSINCSGSQSIVPDLFTGHNSNAGPRSKQCAFGRLLQHVLKRSAVQHAGTAMIIKICNRVNFPLRVGNFVFSGGLVIQPSVTPVMLSDELLFAACCDRLTGLHGGG